MKYIYGPVASWRLGRSLGIDLISGDKHCSFDCVYCQLGNGNTTTIERKVFIPTEEIIKEFETLPKDLEYDYITFSGSGEPTLALNIGEVARELKKLSNKPIALLTNSTTLTDPKVREDLKSIDLVIAKLDAGSDTVFKTINQPEERFNIDKIVDGIKALKRDFAIQVMITTKNIDDAGNIVRLAKEISPKIVYIGTPTRECAEKALSKEKIDNIEKLFKPLLTKSVYSARKVDVISLDEAEVIKRRPKID